MSSSTRTPLRRALEVAIAFVPWLVAMYAFYWLQTSGIWTSDTPHRGKASVVILASGMALSFFIKSSFDKRL